MKQGTDKYTVSFTGNEIQNGSLDSIIQQEIISIFNREGVVLLENIFDSKFVSDLHDYYMLNYQDVDKTPILSSYKLDKGRYFIVPRFTSLFNDVRFYGNPAIISLLQNILGPSWVYQSITSVLSYPGSATQAIHIDAPLLFNSERLSPTLPVHAFTVVLPLVDIDDANGGTRVWPGSHLKPHVKDGELDKSSILQEESIVLQCKRGDCFLMDYRTTHGGEPNISQSARPIITFICTLPWFHDTINYGHIPEMIMTAEDIQKMPEEHHARFNLPKFVDLYTDIGNKEVGNPAVDKNVNTAAISRNAPCHCGSGLRYKQCHGKV